MNNKSVREILDENPDYVYVTPSGKELYFLDWEGHMCVMLGDNLHQMNEDQINKFFQDTLSKIV